MHTNLHPCTRAHTHTHTHTHTKSTLFNKVNTWWLVHAPQTRMYQQESTHTRTHGYTQRRRCSISTLECIPKTVTVIRCAIRWVSSLKGWKCGSNLSKNCQLWSKICLNVEVTTLPRFMTQLSSELLVSQVWGEVEASVFTRKVNDTRITSILHVLFHFLIALINFQGLPGHNCS